MSDQKKRRIWEIEERRLEVANKLVDEHDMPNNEHNRNRLTREASCQLWPTISLTVIQLSKYDGSSTSLIRRDADDTTHWFAFTDDWSQHLFKQRRNIINCQRNRRKEKQWLENYECFQKMIMRKFAPVTQVSSWSFRPTGSSSSYPVVDW